jgi:hypothetical protein
MLNRPNLTFCLHLEDLVSKERRDMIKSHMKIIVGPDEAARSKAIAEPPTQLLGDKQAVGKLALEMQNQDQTEQTRIYLTRALAAIAEKPREVSIHLLLCQSWIITAILTPQTLHTTHGSSVFCVYHLTHQALPPHTGLRHAAARG